MKNIIPQQLKDKRFLLCVSGGADSMVMLHIFLREIPLSNFDVVTVNHNLRKAGAMDALFVSDYCTQKGVKCFVKSIDVSTFAKETGQSAETAARELRYRAILSVAQDYDYICLAHHADDNAETVLLHLIRGGGTRGATGIKRQNGRYFRPLLSFDKKWILDYAKNNDLPFVTDETNAQSDCNRNLLRNQVVPLLKKINPDVSFALNKFASLAQEDDEYLNSLADISSVKFLDGQAQIPQKLLKTAKPLATRCLYKTFRLLGYTKDIETKHINSILELVTSNNGTKSIDLPFGLTAERRYDTLVIAKKITTQKFDKALPFKLGVTQLEGATVCVCGCDAIDATKQKTATQSDPSTLNLYTKNSLTQMDSDSYMPAEDENVFGRELYANRDKIPDTAVFRTRREGDVFQKFGGGTKKLKDFLIDKKICKGIRDSLVLLADGHNVLAVLGVEICADLTVTPDCKAVKLCCCFN